MFNCKVGVFGTCYSSRGIAIIAELQFVYKVAASTKALIKGAPMEQDLTPNFVTVGQGLPRLVQEPPPPGLTDSEDSDDEVENEVDDEEDEEDDPDMQFFQMDNFMAGIHGIEALLGHHQGPAGAWMNNEHEGKFCIGFVDIKLTLNGEEK